MAAQRREPPTIGRGERLLVLGAHPDDESLAAAGLMQRALRAGAGVRVVLATDGDNAPWIQRAFERRWRIGPRDRERFGRRRRGETLAALAALGVAGEDVCFLGFPDQGLTPALLAGETSPLEALLDELVSWRPTHVLAPAAGDLHPDHSALAVYLRLALGRLSEGALPPRLLEFHVHVRGTPATTRLALVLELSVDERARKRAAVLQYASQLAVHRRRYLAHGSEREVFFEADRPEDGTVSHPVSASSVVQDELRLVLEPRRNLGAWGTPTLLLCAEHEDGRLQTSCVRLSARSPAVPVEVAVSRRVLGAARVRRAGRRLHVDLPLEVLGGAQRLFAKLERAHGFFDEAGWIELSAPERGFELPRAAQARPPARCLAGGSGRRPPRVCALIPCFDVAGLCAPVVSAAARQAEWVLVVDDGSRDGTPAELRAAADASDGGVTVMTLPANQGKGRALLAGFHDALARFPFDVLVTLDGDGQHDAERIPALAAACAEGADLALGTRTDFSAMPLRSRFGNTLTRSLLRCLHADAPADTQSGFRALSRAFVQEVAACVPGRRYETEFRILLLALERRRTVVSVPIPTVYIDDNRSSHFDPLADSLRIYSVFLRHGVPGWVRSHLHGAPRNERKVARSGIGTHGERAGADPALVRARDGAREQQDADRDRGEGEEAHGSGPAGRPGLREQQRSHRGRDEVGQHAHEGDHDDRPPALVSGLQQGQRQATEQEHERQGRRADRHGLLVQRADAERLRQDAGRSE